jgi:AraC family transcriptional regulator, ethanolamine operon transcriptional activator
VDGNTLSLPLAVRAPPEKIAPPPARLTLRGFSSSTLDGSMLGGTIGRHMQLGPGRLQASVERLCFSQASLRTAHFSTVVRAVIRTPPDVVTLGFALNAPDPFVIGGERLRVGTVTVFGAGGVNDVIYPAGSTAVTLALPVSLYDREVEPISCLELLRFPRCYPVIDGPKRLLRRLRDVIAAVERLALNHRRLFEDPQWRANTERALLEAFFGVLGDASPPAIPAERLRSARTIVFEADARMNANPMSIPSIPVLCSTLGVSRRTLERAFQDMVGMSPAHYLRVRALNAAHERLLQCPPLAGMVTRVAIDSGFWHMGRFSASYRALFGERPVDTLHQSHD